MYSNLSNFSEGVDTAFVVIFIIILIFLVGLTSVLIYFLIRYREKRNPKPTEIKGNVWLEITWTIIPLILVFGMFYYGWMAWIPMLSKAPDDSLEIKTTAQMWSWKFEYPNGKKIDTLIVPINKPIALKVSSPDVLHSLYIPAFRIKRDIVPGRVVEMWFEAKKQGAYDLFCAEYCGLQHSFMVTEVKVLSHEKFSEWYADTTSKAALPESPQAAGLQIIRDYGCIACHSIDGSRLVGPTYKGIFGKQAQVVTKGKERVITTDANYIKKSIYNPDDDIVKGYSKGLMRSYKNEINEKEIELIIDYLKTLSEN